MSTPRSNSESGQSSGSKQPSDQPSNRRSLFPDDEDAEDSDEIKFSDSDEADAEEGNEPQNAPSQANTLFLERNALLQSMVENSTLATSHQKDLDAKIRYAALHEHDTDPGLLLAVGALDNIALPAVAFAKLLEDCNRVKPVVSEEIAGTEAGEPQVVATKHQGKNFWQAFMTTQKDMMQEHKTGIEDAINLQEEFEKAMESCGDNLDKKMKVVREFQGKASTQKTTLKRLVHDTNVARLRRGQSSALKSLENGAGKLGGDRKKQETPAVIIDEQISVIEQFLDGIKKQRDEAANTQAFAILGKLVQAVLACKD